MDYIVWIAVIFIVVFVPLLIWAIWKNKDGERLLEKANLIEIGMTKEEVFQIINQEPREVTRNKTKGTERYKWAAGQNTYTRQYIRGTGMSIGSSTHNRRNITVIFKDGKVIEISTK